MKKSTVRVDFTGRSLTRAKMESEIADLLNAKGIVTDFGRGDGLRSTRFQSQIPSPTKNKHRVTNVYLAPRSN